MKNAWVDLMEYQPLYGLFKAKIRFICKCLIVIIKYIFNILQKLLSFLSA